MQDIVRDDGQDMVIVGEVADLVRRDGRRTGTDDISREIARGNPEIKDESDGRSGYRGEQCIDDSMSEYALRLLLRTEG